MSTERKYDDEFKKQAVKLAKEVGTKAAVAELCVPKNTFLNELYRIHNIEQTLIAVNRILFFINAEIFLADDFFIFAHFTQIFLIWSIFESLIFIENIYVFFFKHF